MENHTLGTPRAFHNAYGWFIEFPGGHVASMPDERTARCFAAAPALLDACKLSVDRCEQCDGTGTTPAGCDCDHCREFRAAIAQAEGGK